MGGPGSGRRKGGGNSRTMKSAKKMANYEKGKQKKFGNTMSKKSQLEGKRAIGRVKYLKKTGQ